MEPMCSWDGRVGLYIEDHITAGSDAAVVFKRVDFHSGDTRFIYLGNDGTSMPWNDTAQLNYLKPEVREAVDPDHFCMWPVNFPINPLRCGHDPDQKTLSAALVS